MIVDLFSIWHILLIILILASMYIGIILIRKYNLKDKDIHKVLVILSIFTFIFWLLSRISYVDHALKENLVEKFFDSTRTYNWYMILPNSFCSFIGFVTPFIIISNKYKDNRFIEAVYSMAILGLITNTFYPEYIARQPFFEWRTIGAILYHVTCGYIYIILIYRHILKPKLKNWYYLPIVLSIMISIGVLEIIHLDFAESFNIGKPLVPGMELSSLGCLCIEYILIDLPFRYLLEKKYNK